MANIKHEICNGQDLPRRENFQTSSTFPALLQIFYAKKDLNNETKKLTKETYNTNKVVLTNILQEGTRKKEDNQINRLVHGYRYLIWFQYGQARGRESAQNVALTDKWQIRKEKIQEEVTESMKQKWKKRRKMKESTEEKSKSK